MTDAQWQDGNARCMGILLDGRAQETGIRRIGSDSTLLLVLNAHHDVVPFTLPPAAGGDRWVLLFDTSLDLEDALNGYEFGREYEIAGRSVVLFIHEPTRTKGRGTDAERSFLHVLEGFETAASKPLLFGFDLNDTAPAEGTSTGAAASR
jgi:glycogen operon protein